MKITSFVHVALGMMLSGCTYNTSITNTSSESHYNYYSVLNNTLSMSITAEQMSRAVRNCGVYTPLQIGRPKQISLEKIKQAKDDVEVNKLLLENIAQLNKQIKDHNKAQQDHLAEWVKRCNSH